MAAGTAKETTIQGAAPKAAAAAARVRAAKGREKVRAERAAVSALDPTVKVRAKERVQLVIVGIAREIITRAIAPRAVARAVVRSDGIKPGPSTPPSRPFFLSVLRMVEPEEDEDGFARVSQT